MILLLGGTSESLVLMTKLLEKKEEVVLSVATEYGKVFSKQFEPHVVQKRMDPFEMEAFILEKGVHLVLDATHPFADLVSKNAIQACKKTNVPYIRFERPQMKWNDKVELTDSVEEACHLALEKIQPEETIYLTTGSKTLSEYLTYIPVEKLVIRVLPTAEVLANCEALGFEAQQIHALKGPFTKDLNQSLYQKNQSRVMITKESGLRGGMESKLAAAQALDMTVIVIRRPKVDYPIVFEEMSKLFTYLESLRKRDKHDESK